MGERNYSMGSARAFAGATYAGDRASPDGRVGRTNEDKWKQTVPRNRSHVETTYCLDGSL